MKRWLRRKSRERVRPVRTKRPRRSARPLATPTRQGPRRGKKKEDKAAEEQAAAEDKEEEEEEFEARRSGLFLVTAVDLKKGTATGVMDGESIAVNIKATRGMGSAFAPGHVS